MNTAVYFSPRLSPVALGIVLAAHDLLFWTLLRQPSFEMLPTRNVLSVRLLTPATPQPEAVQPLPQPVETPQPVRKPVPQPAPVETPAPAAAEPVAAAPEAVVAPAAPQGETQPLFDADYLANPKPAYPSLSRRLGEEGQVLLRVQVSADGLPLDVEVQAGSGSERLDRAAREAVRRWRFVPAQRGGGAIAATVLVPIKFALKG